MSHARVEEVSDSDPDEMDIEEVGASAPASSSLINPANIPQTAAPKPPNRDHIKKWQCLYPVYFDAGRSREEGRRVSKKLAVQNPLAREICEAVVSLGLQLAFEADKMHPKDWANPGRVRVMLKDDGRGARVGVKNKHHLYIKVAEFLQKHPTNENTPMKLKIQGMPPLSKPPPPPAVPKGWKMGNILPLHSPAVSGGGVSDNLFKDMMAEMQGQQGGAPSPAESGSTKKKDKKKIKG